MDININNNQTLRKNPEEFFYVNLRLLGNPEKVSLFPAKSKIIIRDTTSKYGIKWGRKKFIESDCLQWSVWFFIRKNR